MTPFIITLSGKGGVGKTSLAALIIDELARSGHPGPVLAVDGDPAATLHLALGLPAPETTVADVRDAIKLDAKTLRSLPASVTPAGYVKEKLLKAQVIRQTVLHQTTLDFMAMGRGEGRGCYCAVNRALGNVLPDLINAYPVVVMDNEAGLEHLSRYRLKRANLFIVVANRTRASQAVKERILKTVNDVGMEIDRSLVILNRCDCQDGQAIVVPESPAITQLEINDMPVVRLKEKHPARRALSPVIMAVLKQHYDDAWRKIMSSRASENKTNGVFAMAG